MKEGVEFEEEGEEEGRRYVRNCRFWWHPRHAKETLT